MEDAATVLEYFINDVANLPAEIHHLFEELQAKDKQLQECRAAINSRDNSLQKFIKMNGSHVQNPKEDLYAKAIRSQYQIALRLQDEKIALAQKALALIDRHQRRFNSKVKMLQADGLLPPDPAPPPVGSIKSASHSRNPSRGSPAVGSRGTPVPSGGFAVPTTPASANPVGGDLKRRKILGAPGATAAATPTAGSTAAPGPPRGNVKKYSSRKNLVGRKKKRDDGEEHDEDDEDDADGDPGDDKKLYCFCKQVSWGNMVGCDNPDCQYEWFHWGCVGITKEPAGAWYCDECKAKLEK